MNCIICNAPMRPFFSKTFDRFGLGKVEYETCGTCGFSASRTHYELTPEQWERLNLDFHLEHNKRPEDPHNRRQRYFQQAIMLQLMERKGFFGPGPFLDWGSGEGDVSRLASKFFDVNVLNFDLYITPTDRSVQQSELKKRGYSLVMSNAVFEHVTSRETLNEIESLVAPDGCLAVHTLIPETVPNDPEWMYLLPVHCSFHTNSSMGVLMQQWGYTCSVYNEFSKMWIMFKKSPAEILLSVEDLNKELGWNYLKFKEGFMDYWK